LNEESSAPPALRAGQWGKERIVVPEEEGRKKRMANIRQPSSDSISAFLLSSLKNQKGQWGFE